MKIHPFQYAIGNGSVLRNEEEIDLNAFSCIGILGPVGSGKSQFIKLLADSGLRSIGAFSEYPFCAYLSQDLTRLFTGNTPSSILELYRDTRYDIGRHFDAGIFASACAELQIDELIAKNRRLAHYSEGERQRLGICLASAVRASVTILDEPTTALDTRCRQTLFAMIAGMRKRTKVFVISHRLPDLLAVCDYVIRMEHCRIAEHFPVELIIEKSHILSYYSLQNGKNDVRKNYKR
ncbi:MAG: ATP-binding cassette domain-containing protein [FCB group bacterium]|nr:ATP-binding cassette domain-containing protein [FCB group bacterium]